MNILFAGTPDSAATVLRGLVASGHEVVAALTREDAPVGRKGLITASAVAQTALELGIPVIKANKVTSDIFEDISKTGAELAIVVAYGSLLSKEALETLPLGWYNLHYSLLPNYRGAAPVQRALLDGVRSTGATLFKIDSGMDTGPILGQLNTEISEGETSGELIHRLSLLGVSLLNEVLPEIYSGTATLRQQEGHFSLAPKLSRSEAKLNFNLAAGKLVNTIRAMNPEPMAWCTLAGESFRILRARETSSSVVGEPGEIQLKNGPLVICGDGTALELLEVQPAAKRAMSASDWFRGLKSDVFLS